MCTQDMYSGSITRGLQQLSRPLTCWKGSCRFLSVVTRHSGKQSSVDLGSDEFSDVFTDKLEDTTHHPASVNATSKPNPLLEDDFFDISKSFTIRQLFEARVHLGHKAGMWNPSMKKYILGTRAGIHIFDLDKTAEHLRLALNVAAHIAYRRGIILFVNERPQFEGVVQRAARECGEYYVTNWRGGTLTNSYMLLKTLRLPDLMIFTSVLPSKTAVREAAMACIPSIAVVDSDCDPNLILYPVPGNDDTPDSILLYHQLFADVINKAKGMRKMVEERGDSPMSYSVVKIQSPKEQDS